MRALVATIVAGFGAYQEASIVAGAVAHFGVATGCLMLFFCLLANTIFGAWLNGH